MNTINSRPIEVSATIAVSLLVNYTRERRSVHELAVMAKDDSERRLHNSGYDRLHQAMNHVTIKALRAGVDMEVLAWIVQSTTDRQLETLACEDSNINEHLLKVIETMRAPKVKAPKASKPVKALKIDADAIAAQLKAADSREAGREIIGKALVVELKAIAKTLDLRGISRLRKDELVDHLINSTVGFRLDHEAIRTGAMS